MVWAQESPRGFCWAGGVTSDFSSLATASDPAQPLRVSSLSLLPSSLRGSSSSENGRLCEPLDVDRDVTTSTLQNGLVSVDTRPAPELISSEMSVV